MIYRTRKGVRRVQRRREQPILSARGYCTYPDTCDARAVLTKLQTAHLAGANKAPDEKSVTRKAGIVSQE